MISRVKENKLFKPLTWENLEHKKWYNRYTAIASISGITGLALIVYFGIVRDEIGAVVLLFPYLIFWGLAQGIRQAELISRK